MCPPFVIPGTGHIVFDSWSAYAGKTTDGGQPVAIQGGTGVFKFIFDVAAMMPAPPGPPVLDAAPEYVGTFSIITVQPVMMST